MKYTANLMLFEVSNEGKPDWLHQAQTLHVEREADTVKIGIDGIRSTGAHDVIIRWAEGSAREFEGINFVKIVLADGRVVVNGELNRTFTAPSDLPSGGVKFAVL